MPKSENSRVAAGFGAHSPEGQLRVGAVEVEIGSLVTCIRHQAEMLNRWLGSQTWNLAEKSRLEISAE